MSVNISVEGKPFHDKELEKVRTRLESAEMKAVDVENNLLCLGLSMSLCALVCVCGRSPAVHPCQGQGEPSEKLCVCVCYQGKPRLDPQEFRQNVRKQQKGKKSECGRD